MAAGSHMGNLYWRETAARSDADNPVGTPALNCLHLTLCQLQQTWQRIIMHHCLAHTIQALLLELTTVGKF